MAQSMYCFLFFQSVKRNKNLLVEQIEYVKKKQILTGEIVLMRNFIWEKESIESRLKILLNKHTFNQDAKIHGIWTLKSLCHPAPMWLTSVHLTPEAQSQKAMGAGTSSSGTDSTCQRESWQILTGMARDAWVHAVRHTTMWKQATYPKIS